MHTRVRRTLLLLGLVFLVIGVVALMSTAWNTFDGVSADPTIDSDGSVVDSGSFGPSKTYLLLSVVLPAVGVIGIALSIICAAGLVLSFVLVDALGERRSADAAVPVVHDRSESPFGPPEVIDAPGSR